ncbi:hypothetical protein PS6_011735 [Mucor atramentarius]
MLRLITAATTTSLKSYQLPFQNAEMVVAYILNSSNKTSGATSRRSFDTHCSMSFAVLFLSDLVLSASRHQ